MTGKYKERTLRELYRVNGKYWKTGDTDLLDKVVLLAEKIDKRHWDRINAIVTLATQNHRPVQTVIDALALFGYEMEAEERSKETKNADNNQI